MSSIPPPKTSRGDLLLKVNSLMDAARIHIALRRAETTEAELVRHLGLTARAAERCMKFLSRGNTNHHKRRVNTDELIAGLVWHCEVEPVSSRVMFLERAGIDPTAVVVGVAMLAGLNRIPASQEVIEETSTVEGYKNKMKVGLRMIGIDVKEEEDHEGMDTSNAEWIRVLCDESDGPRQEWIHRHPLVEMTSLISFGNRRVKLTDSSATAAFASSDTSASRMTPEQIEKLHYVFRLIDSDKSAFIKLGDYVNRMHKAAKADETKFLLHAHRYILSHVTEERLKAYVGFKDVLKILLPNWSEPAIDGLIKEYAAYYRKLEAERTAAQQEAAPGRSGILGVRARFQRLTAAQRAVNSFAGRRSRGSSPGMGASREGQEGVEISLERLMELRWLFGMIDNSNKGVVDLRQLRSFFSEALDDMADLDRVLVRLKGREALTKDASKVLFTCDDFIDMILPEGLVACAYPTPRSVKASSEQLWKSRHAKALSAMQIPEALKSTSGDVKDSSETKSPLDASKTSTEQHLPQIPPLPLPSTTSSSPDKSITPSDAGEVMLIYSFICQLFMGGQLSWCYYPNRKPPYPTQQEEKEEEEGYGSTRDGGSSSACNRNRDGPSLHDTRGSPGHRALTRDDAIPSLPIAPAQEGWSVAHSARDGVKYKEGDRAESGTPLTTARSAFTTPRSYRKKRYSERRERRKESSFQPNLAIIEDTEKRLQQIKFSRLSIDEILARTEDMSAMIKSSRVVVVQQKQQQQPYAP
ncbi:hypothetical protein FOL47_010008 [Perkinsus chesapeaki]|uniref:EF-hand domain-containing protein n=1 Tax=Perkinsus chesapeaki TaxID=330153 RepID=A0A7J6MRJ1_PERCH|nr:hypothetical protein FOL47_010008 [Perkinsus chesapeaki]